MTPAEYIRRKEIYDIALSSAQVEAMSRQFREQAAWIVGQDEAYIIDAYYRVAAQIAEGRLSPAEARRAVRDVLRAAGYQADEPGSLRDMQDGTARQKLILDTNIKKAAGYAWHESVKGSLAFPAQELVRYGERRVPRDWETRWKVAWQGLPPEERAKALPGPRMVALTDCAIWSAISRWHDPYPPFDYNSGMDVEPVDYDEAAALGLVAADDEDERHEDVEEEAAVREFAPETRVMPQMSAAPDGMTGLLETWIAAVSGKSPVVKDEIRKTEDERFNAGEEPVKNRNAGAGKEVPDTVMNQCNQYAHDDDCKHQDGRSAGKRIPHKRPASYPSDPREKIKRCLEESDATDGKRAFPIGQVSQENLRKYGIENSERPYRIKYPPDFYAHVFKEHGNAKTEAQRGQYAVVKDDMYLVPDIIGNPDSVRKSKQTGQYGEPRFIANKTIGEINYESIVELKKEAFVPVTLYKKRVKK